MDKLPLSKEIDKAPFPNKDKHEQFENEIIQLSRCVDHDGCPVLKQFEVYARLTRNYATSLSNSTCMNPETIPELVKICKRRPRPPSDHVESPCNKYSDRCLTEKLINQGCYQLANMHVVLTIAQERCKVIEKNREQWSHYFNLIDMKVDFPVL